ncbi:hypothetical protein CLI75_11625, partial [Porphyromonas gingivalis]|uniref:hypothetical protein n=1 Tax=Porphyromonas gingivalis TaxID=837 RepID=UPI000BE711A1
FDAQLLAKLQYDAIYALLLGENILIAEWIMRLVSLNLQIVIVTKKLLFKPILGCEAYCARRTRFDKDNRIPDPYHPRRSIDASG